MSNHTKESYLDWHSASPLLPEVATAVSECLKNGFANPMSRLHPWGVLAQRELNRARESVARLIDAWDPIELVFCTSATEANNLAVKGIAQSSERGKHIVLSAVEHISVKQAAERLRWQGFTVTTLPVDTHGVVSVDALRDSLRDDTALVVIQHANSEIGTIQPIRDLAELCREFDVPLHVDGAAIAGLMPVSVRELGITSYTLSANTFWGPPGAAALWLRKDIELTPQLDGGSQERKLRGGTHNLPAIAGMGIAAECAQTDLPQRAGRLAVLRDRLLNQLESAFANCDPACFHRVGHVTERLPQIAPFRLDWIEGEALLLGIGADRVAAVSGSACAEPELGASHVLAAIGVSPEQQSGGITCSVGWSTTTEEIDYAVSRIEYHGKRLFVMSPMAKRV